MKEKIYVLQHFYDYSDSSILGIFDSMNEARRVRKEILKNLGVTDTFNNIDITQGFDSIIENDSDECWSIVIYNLNEKVRDY